MNAWGGVEGGGPHRVKYVKINTSCIQVLDRVRPPEYRSERLAVLNCGMNAWGPLKGGGSLEILQKVEVW